MKKIVSFFAMTGACCLAASCLTSCENSGKIGFIFLHDENSSYDKNFIEAAKEVCKEYNVKPVMLTNINEDSTCTDAAEKLVNEGCKAIFADSFGHEPYMIEAAKKYPRVQFAHATGTKAHTEKLDNYHNAFASIFEGRYLTGVAAGMKVQQMIDEKKITEAEAMLGYVGAFPYAEVVSGYTSFYLGAKSVCPSVSMTVRYTNSWYSVEKEADAASALIEEDKAVVISQHADSSGAPGVCEQKKVPNVFYNGENDLNTYLVASRINWRPYFRYLIESTISEEKMESDWYGSLANGAVEVLRVNEELAAPGTKAKLEEVTNKLKNGSINVFATDKFTVGGKVLSSYLADVDDMGDFKGETEVIVNGVFEESKHRSAPYFDLRIDGIKEILVKEN